MDGGDPADTVTVTGMDMAMDTGMDITEDMPEDVWTGPWTTGLAPYPMTEDREQWPATTGPDHRPDRQIPTKTVKTVLGTPGSDQLPSL